MSDRIVAALMRKTAKPHIAQRKAETRTSAQARRHSVDFNGYGR